MLANLLLSVFVSTAIPAGVTEISFHICISVMTSDVKHLFVCLLTIFSGEISVHICSYSFFYWVVCLIIELCKFFVKTGKKTFRDLVLQIFCPSLLLTFSFP